MAAYDETLPSSLRPPLVLPEAAATHVAATLAPNLHLELLTSSAHNPSMLRVIPESAPPIIHPSYDDVMQEYIDAGKGSERLVYSRKNLDPIFSGRLIVQIRRHDIRRYINGRLAKGVSPSTINRELDDFSAAINSYAFDHEIPLANPCAGMELPIAEGRVRWITRPEASNLIHAAVSRGPNPHLAAFVQLALHTGCRKNELLRLEVSRIRQDPHSDKFWLLLESKHTKAKKQRLIPLNKSAIGALDSMQRWRDEFCPHSPWVFPSPVDHTRPIWKMDKRFKEACARAGISDFRIHDLRHTFASWLVMAGRPLQVVRDLLGHSSIKMTERYAHLAPDFIVGAVESLEEMLPSLLPSSRPSSPYPFSAATVGVTASRLSTS
ncbi:tyrosine-type recombinase/integrase [Achromobacter aloeverae]